MCKRLFILFDQKAILSLQTSIIRALLCWAMQNSFHWLLPHSSASNKNLIPKAAETAWAERSARVYNSVRAFAIFNSQHYWILKTKRRGRNFNSARYEIACESYARERKERERVGKRIHISAVCKHKHTHKPYIRRLHRSVECAPQERHARSPDSAARPAVCIYTYLPNNVNCVLVNNENW
jgi:hypothetical protein